MAVVVVSLLFPALFIAVLDVAGLSFNIGFGIVTVLLASPFIIWAFRIWRFRITAEGDVVTVRPAAGRIRQFPASDITRVVRKVKMDSCWEVGPDASDISRSGVSSVRGSDRSTGGGEEKTSADSDTGDETSGSEPASLSAISMTLCWRLCRRGVAIGRGRSSASPGTAGREATLTPVLAVVDLLLTALAAVVASFFGLPRGFFAGDGASVSPVSEVISKGAFRGRPGGRAGDALGATVLSFADLDFGCKDVLVVEKAACCVEVKAGVPDLFAQH